MSAKFALSLIVGVSVTASVGLALDGYHVESADCLKCHVDRFDRPVGHFIETNDDCAYCHEINPSGSEILTVTDNTVCQVCHIANSDAVEGGAHLGVSCMTCHDPHSGDYPHRFRKAEVSLCLGDCHGDHDLGVSHPIGETVPDPRVGGAMSCVSTCHSMHRPKEPRMLQMAALDLCRECHRDKF